MSGKRQQVFLFLTLAMITVVAGCSSASSEGFFSDVLTLTLLDPKVLPIEIEPDGDPKDVLYKPRVRYKPGTAEDFFSKDVRLRLRGKKDGGALRTVLQRDFMATGYEVHIRVAFDQAKTMGLVDGATLAFFELVLDTAAEGDPPLRRIEAVYTEQGPGFTVRATDGSQPLGNPLAFFGKSETVLQFRLDAGTLYLECGYPTGPFITEFFPVVLYSEPLAVEADTRQTVAWGASGLDKKGSLYFNQLTLGGILPDIGAVETPIALQMRNAYYDGENALFSGDAGFGAVALGSALNRMTSITAQLGSAVDADSLDPVTQGELALKNATKALKATVKAKKVADKLVAKGSTKVKKLQKPTRKMLRTLQLSFAQLAGFRSNKSGKVFKAGFLPFL